MNEDQAENLSIALLQVVGKLDDTARYVKENGTPEQWERYRRAVGKAMAEVALELAEPLWKEFPHLKPKNLGGPFEVDPNIYSPSICED